MPTLLSYVVLIAINMPHPSHLFIQHYDQYGDAPSKQATCYTAIWCSFYAADWCAWSERCWTNTQMQGVWYLLMYLWRLTLVTFVPSIYTTQNHYTLISGMCTCGVWEARDSSLVHSPRYEIGRYYTSQIGVPQPASLKHIPRLLMLPHERPKIVMSQLRVS